MPLSVKNLLKTAFHAHFSARSLKLAFSTVVAASQSNGLFLTLLGSAPRCESVPFLMVRSGLPICPSEARGKNEKSSIVEPFFLLPEPSECNSECQGKRRKTSGSRKKDLSRALVTDAACCLRRHIARVRQMKEIDGVSQKDSQSLLSTARAETPKDSEA